MKWLQDGYTGRAEGGLIHTRRLRSHSLSVVSIGKGDRYEQEKHAAGRAYSVSLCIV